MKRIVSIVALAAVVLAASFFLVFSDEADAADDEYADYSIYCVGDHQDVKSIYFEIEYPEDVIQLDHVNWNDELSNASLQGSDSKRSGRWVFAFNESRIISAGELLVDLHFKVLDGKKTSEVRYNVIFKNTESTDVLFEENGCASENGFVTDFGGKKAVQGRAIKKDLSYILPVSLLDSDNKLLSSYNLMVGVSKGSATLKRVSDPEGDDLYIPGNVKIGGETYETISIDDNAFKNSGFKDVVAGEGVTKIGKYAFSGSSIRSIRFPTTLQSIDANAFSGCEYLQSISTVKYGVEYKLQSIDETAFMGCINLENVSLAFGTLKPWSSNPFYECERLNNISSVNETGNNQIGMKVENSQVYYGTKLIAPVCNSEADKSTILNTILNNEITSIGSKAFMAWTLESLDITGDKELAIDDQAFKGVGLNKIDIGRPVTFIGESAFADNNLEYIEMQVSGKISNNAFKNNPLSRGVVFNNSVCTVSQGAFANCSIGSIECKGKGTVTLGSQIFSGSNVIELSIVGSFELGSGSIGSMSALNKVTLSRVASIDKDAFSKSSNIESFVVIDGVGYSSDGGVILDKGKVFIVPPKLKEAKFTAVVSGLDPNAFKGNENLVEVSIPKDSTLKTIPEGSFQGCKSLVSITIPDSVGSIGKDAFNGCVSLSDVEISKESSLERLDDGAFCRTSLMSISLPAGLTHIGIDCFAECQLLKNVTFESDSLTIGNGAFRETGLSSIELPKDPGALNSSIFKGSPNLNSIIFGQGSSYRFDGYAVYQGNELIFVCPAVRTYDLPSEVESIHSLAFDIAKDLIEITCEENARYSAYHGILLDKECKNIVAVPWSISEIRIPDSIVELDGSKFKDSDSNAMNGVDVFFWEAPSIHFKFNTKLTADRIVLVSSSNIILDQLAIGDVGELSLSSEGKIQLGYLSITNSNTIFISSTNVEVGNSAFKTEKLCVQPNDGGSFDQYLANFDGSKDKYNAIYVSSENIKCNSEKFKGIFEYDEDSNKIYTPAFYESGISVFVDNSVNSTPVSNMSIGSEGLSFSLESSGSAIEDVEVSIEGEPVEYGADGSYSYEIADGKKRIHIVIRPLSSDIYHDVEFELDGGTGTPSIRVQDGGTLRSAKLDDPIRSGYTFGGWYEDSGCTKVFDSSTKIISDIHLYAKWIYNNGNYLIKVLSHNDAVELKIGNVLVESEKLITGSSQVSISYLNDLTWECTGWRINGEVDTRIDGISLIMDKDYYIEPILRYTSPSNVLTDVVDIKTPEYGQDVVLQWTKQYEVDTSMGVWSGFPSVPAIMGNAVYVRAGTVLYKYDADTGNELARADSQVLSSYYLYLGVGGGMVYDYATHKVYDSDLVWKYDSPKKFSAVFYDLGYFYGLSDGKIYKMEASSGTLITNDGWANGVECKWFGMYGTTSAPVFANGHLYFIEAMTSSDDRGLASVDLNKGSKTQLKIDSQSGRLLDDGWLTYDTRDGRTILFMTAYSQGLFDNGTERNATITAVVVNADGTLGDGCPIVDVKFDSPTLSALVTFKERGYVNGNYLYVLDMNKLEDAILSCKSGTISLNASEYVIYKENSEFTHGSIVVSSGYYDTTGKVYVYLLPYNPPNKIYIFEDYEGKETSKGYFETSKTGSQFSSQAVRATLKGNLIWYLDSGTIYCYGTPANNPYNFELKYNGGVQNISGIGYTALEALKNALKTSGLDYSINNSGIISSIDHADGVWNIEYKDGDGWRKAGLMSADYINVYHTFRITYQGTAENHPIDVILNPDSLVLYASGSTNRTATITATIDCDWEYDIQWSLKGSSVSIDGPRDQRTVTVRSESLGDSTLTLFVESGGTPKVVECKISVVEPPAKLNTYKFFIQMKYDADKVKHSKYNQTMLEEGIEIQAEGVNALDAFEKACAQNGIQFDPYSNETLKGWFNSLFGLGDVNMGNGAWKYWVQYHEGVYNDKTLGYYTEGGNFQFIYDITTMGDVPGGEDKPDPKPTITDKGEIKTGTSFEKKNEDGSTTKIDTETTEGLDGSKHEVETRTDVSEDGSTTTTTTTTTKTDPEGNQTKSESVTVVEKIKDADGNDAERKTVTEKDQDGNIKQSVSDTTTSKDGTVTEKTKGTETKKDGSTVDSSTTTETKKDGSVYSETTSTAKDANGNVTGTTKSETTIEKTSEGTKSSTTETSHDKDGNITGMKEIEETKTESGTKIVERSKDADGNVTGSSEKTVETQAKGNGSVTTTTEVSKDADGNAVSSTETKEQVANKTIAGGKTQTTTTTDSKTTDSSGNVVSSTESAVVVKNKDGTPESFESTKVVKDQNGTVIEEIKKGTTNTKDRNGNEVSKTEYTKTTPEGKTSVDSETVFKKIDNGSQTDSTKTTVVKDKDGKVIDETKVIKTGKNTETDTEKKNSSSTETIRNGVSETRESSTVESKEVSGLKSSVEVEKKGDKVTKAESVTIVPAKDGGLDADSVRMAIDQSSAAMNEVSVDSKDISKIIEVRNDSGASVIVSSEAIGRISEHGASLKVGSGKESIHVDEKVVNRLSGDKDVKLEMDRNAHGDLNDMQKQVVGDRQFIVLGAFVGNDRIHELGGVATVVFGYELRDSEDASKLYVWYVDDNGVKTKMKASYDQSTGRFTMETAHFSVFMVAPEDQPVPTPDDPEGSDGAPSNAMLYIGIAAIVLVFVAAVVLMHRRKV